VADVETSGGGAIQGDANAGHDFIGRDRQQITFNNNNEDNAELWRTITNLETRITLLEHDARNNSRQYWIAIALFVVVIVSIWYLSMKIDNFTRAAQNLSRVTAEQRKP